MTPYPYETATPAQQARGALWWCQGHDIKLAALREPPAARAEVIRNLKLAHEQEVRLRAMRPVLGTLPPEVQEAAQALEKTDRARDEAFQAWWEVSQARQGTDRIQVYRIWEKAYQVWEEASRAWQEILYTHRAEIEALFALECADVPWGPEGLIFHIPV